MFSSGSPWTTEARLRRRASTRRRASSSSRCGTPTRSSSPTRTSTAGRPTRRRPTRSRRTCSTGGCRRGLHRTVRDRHRRARRRFDALGGAQALAELVDDLSNWYVRRSRPRFWKSSDPAAHATLHECLRHARAAARAVLPVRHRRDVHDAPGEGSVHVTDWPEPNGRYDATLAAEMASRDGSSRSAGPLGPTPSRRAPALARALMLHPAMRSSAELQQEIADELNVKTRGSTRFGAPGWTVYPTSACSALASGRSPR